MSPASNSQICLRCWSPWRAACVSEFAARISERTKHCLCSNANKFDHVEWALSAMLASGSTVIACTPITQSVDLNAALTMASYYSQVYFCWNVGTELCAKSAKLKPPPSFGGPPLSWQALPAMTNRCMLCLNIANCSCGLYVQLYNTPDSASMILVCASWKHVVTLDV